MGEILVHELCSNLSVIGLLIGLLDKLVRQLAGRVMVLKDKLVVVFKSDIEVEIELLENQNG